MPNLNDNTRLYIPWQLLILANLLFQLTNSLVLVLSTIAVFFNPHQELTKVRTGLLLLAFSDESCKKSVLIAQNDYINHNATIVYGSGSSFAHNETSASVKSGQ